MNAENLLRVADAIEKREIACLAFNMDSFASDTECKTTACIAGWSYILSDAKHTTASLIASVEEDTGGWEGDCGVFRTARDWLGLSYSEAEDLFIHTSDNFDNTSSANAIATLRYAAKHDVIDWDAAQAESA